MHLLSARLVATQCSTFAIVARSASSGAVSSHASQISFATATGVARRLITRILASFHFRAPLAVCASPQRAARMPGTLLAAIDTPVPVQQKSTPCSHAPDATRSPTSCPTSTQSIGWPLSGPCNSTSRPPRRRGSLYDYAAMRQEWLALGSAFLYPPLYPPTLAWFVAPFAALPFAMGYALWNVLLAASLLVTWWLTAPPSSRLVRLGHLAFALALPSVAFGLLLGQVVIVVAAAVSISWWLLRRNRPFAAGLVLCLIALKPQLALLVPVALLVAGKSRAFLGWAACSLAMLGPALATN